MAGTGETPRAHALGAEMRHARVESGVGFRELARRLGMSHTVLSHWESGRRAPSPEDLSALLGILEVTGPERDRLLELARTAADPNWVTPGVDKQLAALMEYERTAVRITEVHPLLVPGLLQTADYARAIMTRSGATTGEVDHRVTLRLGRRDVLERGVEFTALIGEHVLMYPPCERSIMVDQLRHLLKWGQRDNVTIQAVPFESEWTPMHSGPFVLMEFERAKPVVHLEHYRSAVTLTDGGDAQDFQTAADIVRRRAMSPARTAELITETTDKMEQAG
jgi:transcriptional regulator with XRE-family HTH domain